MDSWTLSNRMPTITHHTYTQTHTTYRKRSVLPLLLQWASTKQLTAREMPSIYAIVARTHALLPSNVLVHTENRPTTVCGSPSWIDISRTTDRCIEDWIGIGYAKLGVKFGFVSAKRR